MSAVRSRHRPPGFVDPVGRYSVVVTNPCNKARYSRTVRVERTGETFHVIWDNGTQIFVGTGIGSEKGARRDLSLWPPDRPRHGANGDNWEGGGLDQAAKSSVARLGPANSNALTEVS